VGKKTTGIRYRPPKDVLDVNRSQSQDTWYLFGVDNISDIPHKQGNGTLEWTLRIFLDATATTVQLCFLPKG
jgi:hypothetical protein